MTETTTFEGRLAEALGRYTDAAFIEFDSGAIAEAAADAAERANRRKLRSAFGWVGTLPEAARFAVVLGLVLLLLVAAIIAGQRRQVPAPFGPAANGLIAFAASGDVFVGDPATGRSTRVVSTAAEESEPLWSPDGTRIAFVRSGPAGDEIFVIDPDGSDLERVTQHPLRDFSWIDWSPDGRWLSVVADVDLQLALMLLPADGSGEARVLVDNLLVDEPSFRPPDGLEIGFRGTDGQGLTALYVVPASGGPARAITKPARSDNPFHLRFARYAHDGTRIAAQMWDATTHQMHVVVLNADGAGRVDIPQTENSWFNGLPVWSPDGTRLAFVQLFRDAAGHPVDAGGRYAIVSLERPDAVLEVGPTLGPHGGQLEWAPDGTRLLLRLDALDAPDGHQVLINASDGTWGDAPWKSNSWPSWQRVTPSAPP
jgi:hypothetical protein